MTMPVSMSMATSRNRRTYQGSARWAINSRTGRQSYSAMIAATEPKLIWKLAPTRASGQNSITASAATASERRLSGWRPSASAASTSSAPKQARKVPTPAPVSSVYPTAAIAPAPAASIGKFSRSASGGSSANSRIVSR
jgi:hypothetical protein